MRKFEVGDKFETVDIYTGAIHKYEIYARVLDTILCNAIHYELDGTHELVDNFTIKTDENENEYIVLWEYGDHKGIYEAKGEQI